MLGNFQPFFLCQISMREKEQQHCEGAGEIASKLHYIALVMCAVERLTK